MQLAQNRMETSIKMSKRATTFDKFLGCAGKKHLGEKGQKATGNSSEEKLLHAANHSKAESKVEAKLYDSAINRTTTAATLS